jgi:eukaryotic-like serine/threonine-protein kinase
MAAKLAPGHVLSERYVVEALLGDGPIGHVYRCRHNVIDRPVTLKLLRPEHASKPVLRAAFVRGMRNAGLLSGDHIAVILDIGGCQEGQTPYFVRGLLDGRDLGKVLAVGGILEESAVITFLLQALGPIGEAHARGYAHGNIKPTNLFVAKDRDGATRLKVLDFAPPAGASRYQSPEEIAPNARRGPLSDIWSLGAVAYELLTGSPPFATRPAILEGPEPPSLRTRRPDVSATLEATVARCLRRAPAERFASTSDLAAALGAARDPQS